MKRSIHRTVTAWGLLLGIFALLPAAAAADVETGANFTDVSRYIWRGWNLAPDNEPALQGGISIAHPSGVALDVWGSYSLDTDSQLDELDYTLSYASMISAFRGEPAEEASPGDSCERGIPRCDDRRDNTGRENEQHRRRLDFHHRTHRDDPYPDRRERRRGNRGLIIPYPAPSGPVFIRTGFITCSAGTRPCEKAEAEAGEAGDARGSIGDADQRRQRLLQPGEARMRL